MKKVLAALMALALAATCAACGDNGGSSSTGGEDSNGSSSAAATDDQSWEKVESAGTLVLGLDDAFPPMAIRIPKPATSSASISTSPRRFAAVWGLS